MNPNTLKLHGLAQRLWLDNGAPIHVTLPFSREHCLAPAEACLRGIERRIEAKLSPRAPSVASLFATSTGTPAEPLR